MDVEPTQDHAHPDLGPNAIQYEERLREAADDIASRSDTDVILYNAPLIYPIHPIMQGKRNEQRHKNIFLILITYGGDAGSAFRLARYLQHAYKKFTICISGYCKSAGTLVAIGADEIAFTGFGELGPLDVQIRKAEDWSVSSGLSAGNPFTSLESASMACFDSIMAHLAKKSAFLSLKMSTEIAGSITQGLFSPIYSQIQPLQIAEAGRALTIAKAYGQRLQEHSKSFNNSKSLETLIHDYPTHDFVIDKIEAERLFRNVRETSALENKILEILGDAGIYPKPSPDIRLLSTDIVSAKEQEECFKSNAINGKVEPVSKAHLRHTSEVSKKDTPRQNGSTVHK